MILRTLCERHLAKKDKKVTKAGIAGKVKKVDVKKGTLTITATKTKKDRKFKVTSKTKIVGPRDGVSEDRLKDDRFAKGAKVTVLTDADGKVTEIRLGTPAKKKKGS